VVREEERRDVNRLGDTVRDPDSIQAPQYRQCGAFWWSHFRHLVWSLLWSASASLGFCCARVNDPGRFGCDSADSVIIPVQCEYFALEGLGKLLNTIKIVQSRLNPQLEIEGILLTMYDVRLRLSNQVVDEVKTHFEDMVFDTIIQRNTRLSEAPSFGVSVIMHDATCKGAINYLNLAREIIEKNGLTKGEEKTATATV